MSGPITEREVLIPMEGSHGERDLFWCPGCECLHFISTAGDGPTWVITGTRERPTVNPSILVHGKHRCHLYIRDGQIQFLGDCTHTLAGQTVPMEAPP